jgi:prolyl 4-hydroxylase
MNPVEHALQLIRTQGPAAAVASLESAAREGDADCWVELATWYLSGNLVPRDLAKVREYFRLAGAAGHDRAQLIYISLLANGTGGPPDWRSAIAQLREFAAKNLDAARQVRLLDEMAMGPDGVPLQLVPPRVLSERPNVILFPALLSREECSYLADRALPLLQPSVVVDPASGQLRPHPVRTSEGAYFPWIDEDPVIHAINRRIAAVSGSDVKAGEPLQVLRYRPGQEYRPHHDALPSADNQRVLTMLVYLNGGYEGGETHFLKTGLAVKGAVGDGLLFHNADEKGTPDPMALHAGLPVTAG